MVRGRRRPVRKVQYVAGMRKVSTWGDHLCIQALSLLHTVNVCIHQVDQPRWLVQNFPGNTGTRWVHLSYHDGEHYASVRPAGQLWGVPPPVDALTLGSTQRPAAAARGAAGAAVGADGEAPATTNEKIVISSTGCDLAAARQALSDNDGSLEAAIEYLLAVQPLSQEAEEQDAEAEMTAALIASSAATAPTAPAPETSSAGCASPPAAAAASLSAATAVEAGTCPAAVVDVLQQHQQQHGQPPPPPIDEAADAELALQLALLEERDMESSLALVALLSAADGEVYRAQPPGAASAAAAGGATLRTPPSAATAAAAATVAVAGLPCSSSSTSSPDPPPARDAAATRKNADAKPAARIGKRVPAQHVSNRDRKRQEKMLKKERRKGAATANDDSASAAAATPPSADSVGVPDLGTLRI